MKLGAEGIFSKWTRALRGRARSTPNPLTLPRSLPESQPDEINTPDDLMLGEMSCLSHHPRTSTIIAISDGEIYEIRRNVLHMLQRNSAARRELDQVYRRRAIFSHLRNVSLFESLNELQRQQCADFLRDKVDLIRVDPGQAIFRQGEIAEDFYMIRIGYVKVSQTFMGTEHVRTYLRPNQFFGDIGLFNQSEDLRRLEPESGQSGRRTSTCSALDDVELVRIKGDHFRQMLLEFSALKDVFVKRAESMLTTDVKHREVVAPPLKEFLDQGLFNAQKLLVLDLDSCTRCDECVKACADTHGGVTRLVREGLRFDKYLVASACRSCSDPYCLVGCPVDAIHRDGSLEITIESHCIGCGLCARNCPYGNINMAPGPEREITIGGSATPMAFVQQQATTCDLCKSVGVDASNSLDEVSCVYACPHNAAFRMDGSQLLSLVQDRSTTPID